MKFGFLFAICFLASSAFAQTAQDILELKVDMSEATYLALKNEENLGGYVSALEAMVVSHCAAEVGLDPYYRGDPKSEPCKKGIAKLLEIDGWNPTALCARDGFRQRTCYETSASQNIGTYDPISLTWTSENGLGSGRISGFDTEVVIAQKNNQKRIGELKSKLFGLDTWVRNGRKDPKLGADYLKIVDEGMRLSCGYPKTILREPKAAPQPTLDSSIPGVSRRDERTTPTTTSPIADVLNRLNAAMPSPTPTPEPLMLKGIKYQRFRLITGECAEFIGKAIKIDPLAAAPVCYREGVFSPNCVTARTMKRNVPGQPTKTSQQSTGFQSF